MNTLLVRGYKDGQRFFEKVKFKPTMFMPSKTEGKFKSLYGENLEPIQFGSMSECKEFVEQYKNVPNMKVHGNMRYVNQYILEKFPQDIEFNKSLISIATLDIECGQVEDNGFPEPKEASQEITAMTVKISNNRECHVWTVQDYNPELSPHKTYTIVHHQYKTEKAMLQGFIEWWSLPINTPDIITGWNTRAFDIPYIITRLARVLGDDTAMRLSPWNKIETKNSVIMGRDLTVYEIAGISQMDYLDLFQKFGYAYGPQESYKLDHIAKVVLDEAKIDYSEYGSLTQLYNENFQLFVDYNIKDVELVDRLEQKMGLLTLAMTYAYASGVVFSDVFGTTGIWDTIIYRELARDNIAPPPNKERTSSVAFAGGYVKEPKIGLHRYEVSFDLNSLYPNLIVQYNMSPDTISDDVFVTNVSIEKLLDGMTPTIPDGYSMPANGVCFRKDKQGVIPRIIEKLYNQRVEAKKKMLATQQILEKTDKLNREEVERLQILITTLQCTEQATKISLNSLYGALANPFMRYYDMRIAEAITHTGQLTVRWAEKTVNTYLNKILKTDKDRVIASDTDSIMVCLSDVVDKFKPNNVVDFLDEFCSKAITPELNKGFTSLGNNLSAFKLRMAMKRENITDKTIHIAAKCYIMNVHDKEGVRYAKPKLKIMGLTLIKTSTPEFCRKTLKKLLETIMNGTEEDVQNEVKDFKEKFFAAPIEAIAFPRGCKEIKKYVSGSTYLKGTPINSRSAINYNYALTSAGLDKKYPIIRDGDKIKFIMLKVPNPLLKKENVIGFPVSSTLPTEFNLDKYIDRELQFEKTFVDGIQIVLTAIGWRAEATSSLDSFFA